MLKELNKKLINIGNIVIASVKYEIDAKYSVYDFFRIKFDKKQALEVKLKKHLK